MLVPFFLLLTGSAHAGAGADFLPGVEGQWGYGAPFPSPDGKKVALTGWNRVGLWVLDLETGVRTEVTTARGAGFAPLWVGDSLVFKAVTGQDGAGQEAWRWTDGVSERLDSGPRIGQPAALPDGSLLWTHGDSLARRTGSTTTRLVGVGDVDLLAPNPVSGVLTWADGNGNLHQRDLTTLRAVDVQAAAGAHPAWSTDGRLLLDETYGGSVQVVDGVTGAIRTVEGTHPRWVAGTHTVLFDRVETGADPGAAPGTNPYTVLSSSLWAFDADTGGTTLRFASPTLHPRSPAALPNGDVLFVDSALGGLWRLRDGEPEQLSDAPPPGEAPPPPCFETNAVSVPYMHQLWDTPDDFDGGWSCGPTSCVQTVAKWGNLPNADITTSWPYAHTSHWGWYIPNNYNFAGYQYDIWGVAKSQDCQGAHGFICREYGGAIWADITLFLNQHGVGSSQVGTSYDTVVGEPNAGYPLIASTSVLGYGHILVIRGYLSSGGSPIHTIVVNDPYGNAGTGSWGNFDGEGIAYDWPGYDNGYLEIGVSQLFTAHGTAPVVETPPADEGTPEETPPADDGIEEVPPEPVDTGTAPPPYPRVHHSPAPGALTDLDDVGGCTTSPGMPAALLVAAGLLAGSRRRGSV